MNVLKINFTTQFLLTYLFSLKFKNLLNYR